MRPKKEEAKKMLVKVYQILLLVNLSKFHLIFAKFAGILCLKSEFCRNLPEIGSPGEMYGYPPVNPPVNPPGPRSLHFRGRRPIPRLPELAINCVRPVAALRDLNEAKHN